MSLLQQFDAFAIYTDGGGYCFSCGHWQKGDSESPVQPYQGRSVA